MDLRLHTDAPTRTGGRVPVCRPAPGPFRGHDIRGHDIPHPIGDPDDDEELPDDQDDDEDDEDEDEPLQVMPTGSPDFRTAALFPIFCYNQKLAAICE